MASGVEALEKARKEKRRADGAEAKLKRYEYALFVAEGQRPPQYGEHGWRSAINRIRELVAEGE